MSSSSTDSGNSPAPPDEENEELVKQVSEVLKPVRPGQQRARRVSDSPPTPFIIAAYRYGDPFRKRRVKVRQRLPWDEFLCLLCSRLDVPTDTDIEIFDESGVEIVSVDDLVPNDVLVVRERTVPANFSRYGHTPTLRDRPCTERVRTLLVKDGHANPLSAPDPVATVTRRSQDLSCDPGGPIRTQEQLNRPVGTPKLTHFIRSNCFGQYFLAEVENIHFPSSGRIKNAPCVVKVPLCDKSTGKKGGRREEEEEEEEGRAGKKGGEEEEEEEEEEEGRGGEGW